MCPPPRTGCVNSCKLRTDAADKALPQARMKGAVSVPVSVRHGRAQNHRSRGFGISRVPVIFSVCPAEAPLQAGFFRSFFQRSFASSPLPPPRRKRTISRRRAEKRPLFSLVVFHNAGRRTAKFFKIASLKNGRIPKKAVDISGQFCYHATITNAMTQSSKQGDPLREVPVGARHSAIKLPNWLYSGCVELEVDADGSSRYSSRDMMVSR